MLLSIRTPFAGDVVQLWALREESIPATSILGESLHVRLLSEVAHQNDLDLDTEDILFNWLIGFVVYDGQIKTHSCCNPHGRSLTEKQLDELPRILETCNAWNDSLQHQADKDVGLAAVTRNWRAIYYLSAELTADREVGLVAVSQNGCAIVQISEELRIELNVAAKYWDSDVKSVASAELHCILIQLTLSLEAQSNCVALICFNVAGSEIARYLVADVDNFRNLHILLSSELSVPPFRLKLVLPDGSCVQSTDATSLRDRFLP